MKRLIRRFLLYYNLFLWERALWKDENQWRELIVERRYDLGNGVYLIMAPWPRGHLAAFNLSFDDVFPYTSSLHNHGEDILTGWLNQEFERMLLDFPWLKVTLFVCPNMSSENSRPNHYLITRPKYRDWVAWLRRLVGSGRVEVADHGYTHLNTVVGPKPSPAEFANLSVREIQAALEQAKEIFASIGITVVGVRPPAWGVGKDLAIVKAVKDSGFLYGALSAVGHGLNAGMKRVSDVFPAWYEGLLNLPQNLTLEEPEPVAYRVIDRTVSMGGMIGLKAHYSTSLSIRAGLHPKNLQRLRRILAYIEKSYDDTVWPATLKEIAEFWTAREKLQVSTTRNGECMRVVLYNKTRWLLTDLHLQLEGGTIVDAAGILRATDEGWVCTISPGSSVEFTVIQGRR